MTHPRAPLTFADAMTRVAGLIGYAEASRIAGRAERTIYAWALPTNSTVPPIDQALEFDAAWRAAGGAGAPFHEAYSFQLDLAVERRDADARLLLAEVAATAKEAGEAIAAALTLANNRASPLDAHRAFAEVTEAVDALAALQRRVASFLPELVGAHAGKPGAAA